MLIESLKCERTVHHWSNDGENNFKARCPICVQFMEPIKAQTIQLWHRLLEHLELVGPREKRLQMEQIGI